MDIQNAGKITDKEIVLDSSNPIEYRTMHEALEDSIGKPFAGWQQACWPTREGNGYFRVWFPQLANTKQGKHVAATNNCVNTLSEDGNTLIYDDMRSTNGEIKYKEIPNLIFAREPKRGPYIFRGVFLLDVENSSPNHYIYKRVGKKVKMIGCPAYDFKIIDEEQAPNKKTSIPLGIDKPIISFACGKSYDLINETHVHAHPLKSPYPATVSPFLMARAKGGKTDYLYRVVDYIDLYPKDKNQIKALSSHYSSVKDYYNKRMMKMGFSKTDVPYRFYLLEPIHRFNPVFTISRNHEQAIHYTFEEIGLSDPRDELNTKAKEAMEKQLVDSINEYVNNNGIGEIKSETEILNIAGLSNKAGKLHPSNYCYNRINKALKAFNGPFLFEYLGPNQYKILGENYPYSGLISQEGEIKKTIGNWKNGFVDITDRNTDWKEYKKKQEKLENIIIKNEDRTIEEEISNLKLEGTDRLAVIKARVNQGAFRSRLLRKYRKCCLCGFDQDGLLIASHIKPWAESEPKERTDVNNGLLLCPNHDKLFDKFYVSFDEKGTILISDEISETQRGLLNINPDMRINMSSKTSEYMEYHRSKYLLEEALRKA